MMEKRLLLILLFDIGIVFSLCSQTLKATKFERVDTDRTAARLEKKDENENPCGLVKISFPMQKGVSFVGNIPPKHKPEYKNGEWWVYMVDGSKKITIKATGYHPYEYPFPEPIRGLSTYKMIVEMPNNNSIKNSSALLRSAFVPGWGQFYKNRNGRGTLIVIGETMTLAAGGFSLYNELTQKSIMDKPEVSYQDYIAAEKSYEQWNTARHILFITAAVIYSLNLVDAYLTPTKSQNNIVFTPNVMNANGEMAFGTTLSIKF
jgi:hypothetical protein